MKGKGISKVLSCLVVFAILMSAIPFSVLAASNSSDDVMGDVLDSLSEVDTHEDIVVSGVDNATNEAGCNFSDSYIADNTSKLVTALGVTDTLTVNVKNTLGYSLPDCGGRIKVALFDEGYHFKGSVDVPYSGGKSSCPVTFYGVTDGKYFIEVYQTPNTGLKLSEFWGADGVTVSGSTTKKDFVRHTQWVSDVKINGESPGNKIKVNPGEKVHVDITVKNDDKGAFSKNVKVRLLLTKDRSSSFYDLDETHGPVTIERNKEGYFGYDFKPSEAGTYYFYCVVYSDYNDKYIVVDQHDWCKAFERKGTLLLSVPYEHQDDVPWCVLASTSMLLKYYGKNVHMWDIAEAEGISRDRGANFKQMANYITSMGFDVPQKVDDDSKEDDGEIIAWTPTLLSTPDNLRDYMARELTEERNPIILMVSDINHSIVVMGVTSPDIDNPTFYIHDPSGAFLSDALEKKPETLETLISYPVHWEDFKKYWRTILHLSGGFCTISVSADPNPSSATMSDLFFCVNDKSGSAWREYDKGIKWNRSGTEVIDNDYSISFPPSAKPIFSVSATTTLGSPERQECELVLLDSETVIKHSTVNLERNSFKRYGYGIEKGLTFADYGFAQGRHDIYLSLRDKHGKELDRVGPIRFTIKESTSDTTPPETKCILSPSSPNGEYGWYVTPVTVTLESTDDSSGIEWIKYRIDSGSWQIYSGSKASFKVSEDGLHYITYYAKDKAGNEEKQKLSPFFFIDKTKPSASISINNGAEYANSMSVTLHLTYSDNMGVRDCRYKNEGKSWTSWESCSSTKSWTLAAGEGTKKVYYQVRDTAGNTKEVYDTIVLKQEEPKLCTSPDPPSPNFGTVAKDQTRSWDFFITNCGSGTLTWSVSDDRDWITVNPTSGSTTTEADVVTVTIDTHGLSPGTHTGYVTVTSNGGSKTGTITVEVPKPSNKPPTNPTLTPDKSSPQLAGTTIKWTASATDPDGDQLYYRFWLRGPATGNSWQIKRDWSTANTWTWSTTSDDVGESDICVWIRDGHHASTRSKDIEKIVYDYRVTPEKQRPTAKIESITPNPATQGKDTVHFKGHGTDTDGYIVEYYWTSSKDGFMSSSKEFTKSASDLSVGTHTIYFKVKDNDGQWSDWDTAALTIKPSEKPDLIVSSLTFNPNPANKDKDVTVKVTVKNQGKGDAGPHYEFLGYPDRYTLLKEWYCSGLKAGASRTFTHTLENVQSSDTYEACADWGQVVEESNEDNNCLTAHLTVQSVSELNYKLDEYGIIQQEYNSNYADNKASPPFGLVLKPYIDLIPYGSVSDKVKVEIGIKNGQVTIHDPIENAILSSDKSKLTWSNQKITTDYHAELFYEANFLHPQEVEAKIIPDQLKADVRNICGYPLYNIIVLYPDSESGYWHYGTLDYLGAGAKRTVYLSSKQSPESVVNNLYNYLEGALNDVGLVTTQHRNDWISEWLNYWLGMSYGSIDQSRVIYRIPQNLYEQYFTCSASPEPSKGMVRVGLVELFNVPTTSDQTKCKVQITSDSSLQDRPSIVYANGYYYVAYQSWEKGRGIFIKKFDPQWNFKKKKEVVSGSAYYDSPSLVFANNKLYVAYVSNEKGANKNDYDVIVKEYDPNSLSCTRGEKYLTTLQSCQDLPALYYKNGYFYLAYQSWEKGNGDIFIKKFDSNWNLKKKVQVTSKSSYQDRPSIIYANGYFYVAYHSKETGDLDIFVKRLDANLKLDSWKKQITSESSHQSYPFITFVNNQFTIVYASTETGTLGIYMKKYNRNWNFIGKTKVVDSSANERRPSHTWDGSNYWVAYVHNYGESKDWNIFAIIPGCEDGASPTPTPSPSCCPSMSITTGQDTYMPGDNVYVSITLTGRSGCTFRLNSPSIVSLIAPTGETVTQTDMAQGITSSIAPGGHYTIGRSMKLPLNAPLGRYDVKVSLSGGKCTKTANGLFHVSYSEPV